MNTKIQKLYSLFLTSLLVLGGTAAGLAQNTPGFNNKIPESILTPDHVESPIGDLNFFDGMPDKATVQKLYDNLLFMRGVEAFLSGIPATSIEAIRLGIAEVGAKRASDVVIFDKLMDSDPLFLTGNTDTVYAMGFLELDRDGPTVVVIPPKCGPGTLDDAWQRFVVDMGAPGLDKGKGGKYLILPPDYEGDLDPPVGGEFAEVDGETYIVAKSPTYVNWLILRGFLVDGKPDAANAMFKNGLKIYPLKDKKNPPKMKFISGSEVPFNTIHANDFQFYEELHHIIDREPLSLIDLELRGLIASIGIQKGKPFEPDARTKELLTKAVAVGNATARAIFFRPMKEAFLYEDSGWFAAFVGGSHEWLKDKGQGGRYLDARTLCFYMGTVNTPAMVNKMVGAGSQYALIAVDENSDYLDGGKNYKLNIPANVPAKDFWSIVVYDPQTRSQLQTGQPFPAKNNKRHKLDTNKDGSVDLYFGAKAPEGKEANWIQTVPGKGWFGGLRLYGPLEPWFDKTWRPGEIELMDGPSASAPTTPTKEPVKVTANNYVRAESDIQMRGYIKSLDCFGKFGHYRKPYDVDNQVTVSGNRDTLYSIGVFDLKSPLTVTLPETEGRYQSLMIVSQDHSIWGLYGPKTGTLTEEKVGTRYVCLAVRTFMDPNDEKDMKAAHRLQDAVRVKQADIGTFEVPAWSKEEVEKLRDTVRVVASTVTDLGKMFGKKEELDPVYWMLGAALGWGGLPADVASYVNVVPEKNDGKTAYTLTAKDVPVDAFWSVTLYDKEGWMPVNQYNAYSFNNVTAKKDKDGSITIHFGGDPKQLNFLPIVPGWNYIVRLYQPKKEILDGSWTFPAAEAVE